MKQTTYKNTSFSEALLPFIDKSPTAYHAAKTLGQELQAAGFTPFTKDTSLSAGEKYFLVKGGQLLAFVVPKTWQGKEQAKAETHPLRLWGAHTDAPGLKVKPLPESTKEGYEQLLMSVYGGPLTYTWLDRNLGIAGVVYYEEKNTVREVLVHATNSLLYLPSLAIHLQKTEERTGLTLNPETHLRPILSLAPPKAEHLAQEQVETSGPAKKKPFFKTLVSELATKAAGKPISPDAILSFELFACPCETASFSGRKQEFITSPRLDNLSLCHAGLMGLLTREAAKENALPLLFASNHEEIGSLTAEGAASHFLRDTLKDLSEKLYGKREALLREARESGRCVSADVTHALHPNYPERHDEAHRPILNGGVSLKKHAKQRCATAGRFEAELQLLAKEKGLTLQLHTPRDDFPSGGTIGPIVASRLAIETVDLGSPVLGMHSIRELGGRQDHEDACLLAQAFFG